MEFGKINFENKKEYSVCEFDTNINENIKIKEEKIIIGSLITEKNIISYENIIVIGDIECNYLSVLGDLLCTGSIKCKDLDVERNFYHTAKVNISCSRNVSGKDVLLKNIKLEEEPKVIEKIIEKSTINTILELKEYRRMKENIIKEQVADIRHIEVLEVKLKKLGSNIPECARYAEFIKFLMFLVEKKNIKLVEHLSFINLAKKIPEYIKNIKCVKTRIESLENINVERLEVNIESDEEILQLSKYAYETMNWLKEKNYYYYVMNTIFNYIKDEEVEDDINNKKEINKEKNIRKSKNKEANNKAYTVDKNLEDKSKTETIIYRNSLEESINLNDRDSKKEDKNEKNNNIEQKYNGATVGYNALEILFYKIRSELNLYELKIIKKARIAGYKTVLIISKLSQNKDLKLISKLEEKMNEYIVGEDIKIIPYSSDKKEVLSKILNIEEKSIILDEKSRHIDFVLKTNIRNIIDEEKEKMIILELFPYNKLQFFYKEEVDSKNEENKVYELEKDKKSEEDKKVEDAVDSILNIFFK